jgi:hypothetical protein
VTASRSLDDYSEDARPLTVRDLAIGSAWFVLGLLPIAVLLTVMISGHPDFIPFAPVWLLIGTS